MDSGRRAKKDTGGQEATRLFENYIPVEEFLAQLMNQFTRKTVYVWHRQGMPCKKIKGRLFVHKTKGPEWLERTSQNGDS